MKKEKTKKETPLVLNMSFEQALTLALNTPLPKKRRKKEEKK